MFRCVLCRFWVTLDDAKLVRAGAPPVCVCLACYLRVCEGHATQMTQLLKDVQTFLYSVA